MDAYKSNYIFFKRKISQLILDSRRSINNISKVEYDHIRDRHRQVNLLGVQVRVSHIQVKWLLYYMRKISE